jgi:imidazolonepropionase-like amidohydrolase
MKTALIAAMAGFICAVCASAAVPSAIAIKDARVITVSGPDLPRGTVLVRDGLIEDVGPDLTIPADAWVIDGTGLTVYPGFIDGLSTWGIPSAAKASAAAPSSSPPRAHGPEDRPEDYAFERAADLMNPSDARLQMARDAGFTTAAAFPERGIFGGEGAIVDLAGVRGRDMVVASRAGQYIALRTGPFSAGFPNSLMGVIAYIRQTYLDLDWYKRANTIYAAHVNGNRRPGYDHYLEALGNSPRVLLPATEAQQIDRMLSFGAELKQPSIVYGLHEAYRRIDELSRAKIPVLVSLKWPAAPKDADPTAVPDYRTLVMRDQAPSVPGLLAKAGVPFGFYDDGVEKTADLKKAVKRAIDAGLPQADAIRALTLSVAEMYGVADRLGSIEKGKIANLVVTRGDAFADKTKIEYLFVDGQQFKPSEDVPAKVTGDTAALRSAGASLVVCPQCPQIGVRAKPDNGVETSVCATGACE